MFELPNVSIPISIFLFVFGIYMAFYVLYSLFNIYHLMRYGVYGIGLYLIVTIFTGGTILLLTLSTMLLSEYDWTLSVSLDRAVEFYHEDVFPKL